MAMVLVLSGLNEKNIVPKWKFWHSTRLFPKSEGSEKVEIQFYDAS